MRNNDIFVLLEEYEFLELYLDALQSEAEQFV